MEAIRLLEEDDSPERTDLTKDTGAHACDQGLVPLVHYDTRATMKYKI